jgi:hypothetical protein
MSFDDDGGMDFDRRQYGRAIRAEMIHSFAGVGRGVKPDPDPYGETLEETVALVRLADSRRASWGKRPVVCQVPRDDPEKPRPAPRKYRYGPTPEL